MSDSVRGYPLRAFVICLIAYTTAQMDLALFGYAVPAIRGEFGLTLSEVMAIVSAAFLLGGALLVVLGWLADRVGRLPLFQFSLLGSSFLVALISIAPGVITLTALRGASIALGGLSYPITGAIITEEVPARLRGLFMGLLQIGYPLGRLWARFYGQAGAGRGRAIKKMPASLFSKLTDRPHSIREISAYAVGSNPV